MRGATFSIVAAQAQASSLAMDANCQPAVLQVVLQLDAFLRRVLEHCRPSPALAEGVHRLLDCAASIARLQGLQ